MTPSIRTPVFAFLLLLPGVARAQEEAGFYGQTFGDIAQQALAGAMEGAAAAAADPAQPALGEMQGEGVSALQQYYREQDASFGTWANPAPQSQLDWIYYHYGTACYGMDWRLLKAFSQAESNERTNLRNSAGYEGLGQWKTRDCVQPNFLTTFVDAEGRPFLTCDDMLDPEANVAATAGRLHRFFKGEKLVSRQAEVDGQSVRVQTLERDSSWRDPMVTTCPQASASDIAAMSYIGHNNGPAVLKRVLKVRACEAGTMSEAEAAMENTDPSEDDLAAYRADDAQWKAVWRWYDLKDRPTQEKVDQCREHENLRNRDEYLKPTVNDGEYRCVIGRYGIYKWRYGWNKIGPKVRSLGIAEIYPAGARNPAFCPAAEGERVYPRDTFPTEACQPHKRDPDERGDCR